MGEAPVFVKVDKFKELSSILQKVQSKVNATNATINQLNKIKDEEDAKISECREHLNALQERLDKIAGAMHEPAKN